MKKLLYFKLIYPLLRHFFGFFFSRRFLNGKYFETTLIGWKWVLRSLVFQKVFRFNSHVPWPVSSAIAIDDPAGIFFHPDDLNNFQTFGCYFSNPNGGRIVIGRGTWIAPNVGIITTNHKLDNLNLPDVAKDVVIGEKCWIGMNAIILPGVHLGVGTVVAAGSVVTKSFEQGFLVVGGNPAQIIRHISAS